MNGTAVTPIEANSSSSRIATEIGSTVELHWAYTYVGDGRHTIAVIYFAQQVIGFKSTSHTKFQVLAKKMGLKGNWTLASPLPPSFEGRVDVIQSNSTLVIRDIRASDALKTYHSRVDIRMTLTSLRPQILPYHLAPIVKLILPGMAFLYLKALSIIILLLQNRFR